MVNDKLLKKKKKQQKIQIIHTRTRQEHTNMFHSQNY